MKISDSQEGSLVKTSRKDTNACMTWFQTRRDTSGMSASPISMSQVRRWRLLDGRIEHDTGGFFSIVGIRTSSDSHPQVVVEQPIILQPEIGILGILVKETFSGPRILVQAKGEPGNVGDVQLAPTVQATVSNYTCVHGGKPTPYLDYFLKKGSWTVPADSRQSEQGTRFLGKYNRNMTVMLNGETPNPVSDVWNWCDAGDLLNCLREDFIVNTDLRSVLATSNWALFSTNGEPFSQWKNKGGFGEGLFRSSVAADHELPTDHFLSRLKRLRDDVKLDLAIKPIGGLSGWTVEDERIVDLLENDFEVRFYRVNAPDREVTNWDQPLIHDLGRGEVTLVAQHRQGSLHFLFRGRVEPGFHEKIQFGPSFLKSSAGNGGPACGSHDPIEEIILSDRYEERLTCLMSEEGGRFYQSTSRYRILEFPEEINFPERIDYCWATLRQISRFIRIPGVFTNEARSAISLLLSWLPGSG